MSSSLSLGISSGMPDCVETASTHGVLPSYFASFFVKEKEFEMSAPCGACSHTVSPSARLWMRMER